MQVSGKSQESGLDDKKLQESGLDDKKLQESGLDDLPAGILDDLPDGILDGIVNKNPSGRENQGGEGIFATGTLCYRCWIPLLVSQTDGDNLGGEGDLCYGNLVLPLLDPTARQPA